ncbi:GNAT family N-acetyltransferase [Pseudovibrio exalbescens]|uniref:GNAT family N-acetyltransferase n=1 Tax=Pseudovibrio exalbescens TaxID=197461 RepID=UPI00042204DE|nr:GNAT family N-acetyltransferase [Pseudovibrio exalbescens]
MVSTYLLETERLRARSFAKQDLQELQELHKDPEVNRYLTPKGAWDLTACRARLSEFINQHKKYGFGIWRLENHSGQFVGWAGFALFEETAEVELQYAFRQPLWGIGLGTEITRHLTEWFFENTYYTHLIARVHPDNLPVKLVLMREGLHYRETRSVEGEAQEIYQVLSPSCRRLALSA